MSDEHLRDELVTLFAAGHETTANALTFAWRLVARHPDVAAKLYEEVDRELPDDPADADAVDRLPYTRAVIADAMRLYPPAWVLMREAKEDVRIGPEQHLVRQGDIVITSQWVVHHDARWWPDPDRFDPGRWLDEDAKEARPKYAYFPFGGGPRSCIGEAFAWTEAILLLATLARRWRMEDVSDRPLRLLPTITLRPRDPLQMKLYRR
jgi:cytochrome P450